MTFNFEKEFNESDYKRLKEQIKEKDTKFNQLCNYAEGLEKQLKKAKGLFPESVYIVIKSYHYEGYTIKGVYLSYHLAYMKALDLEYHTDYAQTDEFIDVDGLPCVWVSSTNDKEPDKGDFIAIIEAKPQTEITIIDNPIGELKNEIS